MINGVQRPDGADRGQHCRGHPFESRLVTTLSFLNKSKSHTKQNRLGNLSTMCRFFRMVAAASFSPLTILVVRGNPNIWHYPKPTFVDSRSWTCGGFWFCATFITLPVAAWADGIDLINHFGTITISNAGITSKGSQLSQFNALNSGHSMGSVSFSTGALISGSIQTAAFFPVQVRASRYWNWECGQPKGVIFSGAFSVPSRGLW